MQALRDLLQPERITSIVDVVASEVEGSPPYQRMLDEGVCSVTTVAFGDDFYEPIDLLQVTGTLPALDLLHAGDAKVAVHVHVSFFPEYTFGPIDNELRRLGFILHCFADSYLVPILSKTPVPHPDPHQIAQCDLFYVRDFTKPMAIEQWKHLALIAHHVCGSFDLAMLACSQVSPDAPKHYRAMLETL